ncbi:MAG: IPT/TIG domain protein [Pelotomaculum sp. PtaU1.Bin035]|nr:MAG: IPT/TIG domain protein [Pelotomaculum sp. PtaU1.Bin035]
MNVLSDSIYKCVLNTIAVSSLLLLLLLKTGAASAGDPSLSLSPVIGPPGTPVVLTGTGFPANRTGTAWFDTDMDGQEAGEPSVSVSSDGSGRLSAAGALNVPGTLPGYYPVRVRLSVDGSYYVTYSLFKVRQPNITIGLGSGPPGTPVIISGTDFAANASGWIWFDKNKDYGRDAGEPAMWATTGSNGDFRGALIIPNVEPGSYPILADIPNDGNNDGWTSFSVVSQFILSQNSGPPGAVIAVTGKGLGEGIVWFDTDNDGIVEADEPSTTANEAYGRITASLAVPNVSQGTYPVKLSINNNVQCTVNFTVKGQSLSLSARKGRPGDNIVVTGTLFPQNTTGRIWFDSDGNSIKDPSEIYEDVTTTNSGDFTTNIYIPSVTPGAYAIMAEIPGGAAFKPAAAVSVMPAPSLSLNLNSGPAGTFVVVNGRDFAADTAGSIWFDIERNGEKDLNEPSITMESNEYGAFRTVLTVPDVSPGAYGIYAAVPDWGEPEAWGDFYVDNVDHALPGQLEISSVTPYDGAEYVNRFPNISLIFNTTIVKGPDYNSIVLSDEDGNTVKVNAAMTGQTVNIRPAGLLKAAKTYMLLVPALAVLDTAGSGMAEDYIITFTTKYTQVSE